MTLDEFLQAEAWSVTDLSEATGIPRTTLVGYLYGTRLPKAEQVAVIVKATRGKVGARDLRPDFAALFDRCRCQPSPASRRLR